MHFKYRFKENDLVKNKSGYLGVVLGFIPHVGYKVKAINGEYEYEFIIGGRDLHEGRWNHRTISVDVKGYVGSNPNGNVLCTGRIGQLWKGVFHRCYDPTFLKKNPTYVGSSVSAAWNDFQVFAEDVQSMPHFNSIDTNKKSYYLDKDIITSTKVYSKETCVFVPQIINAYFRDVHSKLFYSKTKSNRYRMSLSFNGKRTIHLFDTQEECDVEYRRLFSEKGLALIETYKNLVDIKVVEAIKATL